MHFVSYTIVSPPVLRRIPPPIIYVGTGTGTRCGEMPLQWFDLGGEGKRHLVCHMLARRTAQYLGFILDGNKNFHPSRRLTGRETSSLASFTARPIQLADRDLEGTFKRL